MNLLTNNFGKSIVFATDASIFYLLGAFFKDHAVIAARLDMIGFALAVCAIVFMAMHVTGRRV